MVTIAQRSQINHAFFLDLPDQTQNSTDDVADSHFTRLGGDQTLANFAHSIDERSSIPRFGCGYNTEEQLSSGYGTWP